MSFRIVRGASTMMASLLATSSLFAGASTNSADSCCCVKPNNCKGVTLCHTQPDLDCWNRFHIDIGFILEQARITGGEYAYTATGVTTPGAGSFGVLPQTSVSILTPSFDADWGVTATLGYAFEHDNWYADAHFDWLQTTGTGSSGTGFNTNLVPVGIWALTMNNNAAIGGVASASSNFEISYYNLMLDLGRGTYVTDCLIVNPHAGLKFSFIYDTVTNQYSGGNIAAGNAVTRTIGTDFWGVGPSFGLDTSWGFTEGWSLFLDANAAILLSYSKTTDATSYTGSTTYATSASTGNMPTFAPTIKTMLGIEYQRKIYCDQQMICARAGWDTSIFWNQFNRVDVLSGGSTTTGTTQYGVFSLVENNTFGLTGFVFELGWSF